MKSPKITYTLHPTSDIKRIALIDDSRQKLEAVLSIYPIRESLYFLFGNSLRLGVNTLTDDGFNKLTPDHGYQFILRVSPDEDGYTAIEAFRGKASDPWKSEGHPLVFHFDNGKAFIKRHFDKMYAAIQKSSRVAYQLYEASGYDAGEKLFIERAKQHIEAILTAITPEETLLIGFGGKQLYCIENEPGLSLLKEQGCKHIFEVRPEKDGYIVSKLT